MSQTHPIIAITGSSGAGTTSVTRTFQQIFRREGVDAALIAQNGRVGRHYYRAACAPYDRRQTLTLEGMIVSSQRYGFAYTDGTGYQVRNLNYDTNLLYEPPPSLPQTSNQYTTLSWKRVR